LRRVYFIPPRAVGLKKNLAYRLAGGVLVSHLIKSKWTKYIIVLIALTFVLSFVMYTYRDKKLKEKVPILSELFYRYDEYVLKREIRKWPNKISLYFRLAELYSRKEGTNKFMEEVRRAMRINPDAIAELYSFALTIEARREFEKALEVYRLGVQLDKGYKLPFHDGLGTMYYNLAQLDRLPNRLSGCEEALRSYREALKHIDGGDYSLIVKGRDNLKRRIEKQIDQIQRRDN